MDKRGPKIGDAASLWNFTPSPGWTKEESLILKLCLMKFGIGQRIQIQATGLLPGKLIQQLNGATQRLLGQQSLAAFSGLRLDVDVLLASIPGRRDPAAAVTQRRTRLLSLLRPLLPPAVQADAGIFQCLSAQFVSHVTCLVTPTPDPR